MIATTSRRARDPLKVTTNDDEHGQEEDHDEEQQPDYHEEGSVGSSLRRSAGSFASPPSVSSTAGRPTFIHGAASDLLLRAAQLIVSPQLLLLEELWSRSLGHQFLFTGLPTETVWKIWIGVKLEPDESVKQSEEAQSLPRCATKDAPSRPLSQFPNSFTRRLLGNPHSPGPLGIGPGPSGLSLPTGAQRFLFA